MDFIDLPNLHLTHLDTGLPVLVGSFWDGVYNSNHCVNSKLLENM